MVTDSWNALPNDTGPWNFRDENSRDQQNKAYQDIRQDKMSSPYHTPNTRQKAKPEDRLGDYRLGHTLGEGEFGKVKIGWNRNHEESRDQTVAVKVISRGKLNNPNRLAKVYREIAILEALDHPNIVHLHEVVETETTFGIVLQYASGGELFDHILKHRYLTDDRARPLFAQLVSGVGYLHRNGIIHRDLKLENLLLDAKENIIITDFGFANNFDPAERLPEDYERHLHDREYLRTHGLDKQRDDQTRPGDLMQTSCGSPCYAAPELVVSDGLYSGKKVDVWSIGVILYAMLAGYLPFDDDPANPEGDNINLLYKYICNTPLVFPGYVSPHAKDVLRRILVADPVKRADLFEVARHSWLSEYSKNVEAITSGVPLPNEKRMIPKIPKLNQITNPDSLSAALSRSASTKEPAKAQKQVSPVGLSSKPARNHINQEAQQPASYKSPRNTDRRTIQVEYVAPPTQTNRANGAVPPLPSGTTSQARDSRVEYEDRPMPPEKDYPATRTPEKVSANGRSNRNAPRATSDTAFMNSQPTASTRPSTGGSTSGMPRLPPSRGSYGQPSAAAVAPTNVEGRFTQPIRTSQKPYNISSPLPQVEGASRESRAASSHTQPSSQTRPSVESSSNQSRGHRRSHTLTNIQDKILGRNNSSRRTEPRSEVRTKPDRTYPPTSMRPVEVEPAPRKSTESRDSRRSFGLNRHKNDAASKDKRTSRRFSILPRSARTPSSSQTGSQTGYRQPGPVQGEMAQPSRAQSSSPWNDGEIGAAGEAGAPESEEAYDEYEKRGPLPGKNRRFNEAYEKRDGAGSSGAARRVMELFRRRK